MLYFHLKNPTISKNSFLTSGCHTSNEDLSVEFNLTAKMPCYNKYSSPCESAIISKKKKKYCKRVVYKYVIKEHIKIVFISLIRIKIDA